jgi:hypothetical protein
MSVTVVLEDEGHKAAVKIQSLWRGVRERVQYNQIKRHLRPPYRYFSSDEIKETLSATNKLATFHEKRQPYRYKTGGVYVKQWLGGFRDGWGVMIWASDAEYEGYWILGRPCGEGRFTLEDGRLLVI